MSKRFTEPPFWEDILQDEPIFKRLVDNFEVIEKEIIRLFKINKLIKVFYKYPVQKKNLKFKGTDWWFIDEDTNWKLSPVFGAKHDKNIHKRTSKFKVYYYEFIAFIVRTLCPQTTKFLRKEFNEGKIINTSINVLHPGSTIRPHRHPTFNNKHRMNYHLAITDDPEAYLTVGYETKSWKRGNILAFKNSGPYRHSVVHNGKNIRIILMLELDVEYLNQYGVFKGERIRDDIES